MAEREQAGLALGPQVRSRRASVRAAIAERRVSLAELLLGELPAVEEIALGMRVDALIGAVPGIGDPTCAAILRAADVEAHERLGALTLQRRRSLLEALKKETRT